MNNLGRVGIVKPLLAEIIFAPQMNIMDFVQLIVIEILVLMECAVFMNLLGLVQKIV
jgi:hypothetical protein